MLDEIYAGFPLEIYEAVRPRWFTPLYSRLVDGAAFTHPFGLLGYSQDSGHVCFADLTARHFYPHMVC